MGPGEPDTKLSRAVEDVRAEYARRHQAPRHKWPAGVFDLRLAGYDRLFANLGLLPLGGRRFLDVGCENGSWLDLCCRRWGAQPTACTGVDLMHDRLADWRAANPDSPITLVCAPVHLVDLPAASFEIVHQSMLLSSVTDRSLRDETARRMWDLLREGGVLISYDFWTNPTNPRTVGMPLRELRRLFPDGRLRFFKRLTLAAPLMRLLAPLGVRAIAGLERLRFLNTHYLVAFERPPRGAPA